MKMSIKICDTIKFYCESKDNTEAIDLFYDKPIQPQNNFEDLEKYSKAQLYFSKFQYDIWKFRYDLWKSVWGYVLEDFKEDFKDIIGFSDYEDYYWGFYVAYKINNKKYRFSIAEFDSKDDILYVYASKFKENGKNDVTESAINGVEIDDKLLENKKYNNCNEWYTRSKHSISIKERTEVTDADIKAFREAAKKILEYIIYPSENVE